MSRVDWSILILALYFGVIALIAWRLKRRPFCSYCSEPAGTCEPDCPERRRRDTQEDAANDRDLP